MADLRIDPESALEVPTEDTGYRFRLLPVIAVALIAAATAFAPIPALSPAAHRTLVVLIVAGGFWITEALPVAVTALFIPVLGVLLGITDAKGAFAGFGDPIVFLFFGTFLLTDAAARHRLERRLAGGVLNSSWVAVRPSRMIWALAFLGCGISAWVNNTATTALLLPLALTSQTFGSKRLLTGVLLMTSYAPSLGGLATPVGTAPNLIGLRLLEQATGTRPSFAGWCAVFAPLALLSTIGAAWVLQRRAGKVAVAADAPLRREPIAPRPWSRRPGEAGARGDRRLLVRLHAAGLDAAQRPGLRPRSADDP